MQVKVTGSTSYDVALTFTDDTELANIIGHGYSG